MMISTTTNNSAIDYSPKTAFFKILTFVSVALICLFAWDVSALAVDNSYFMPSVKETLYALIKLITLEDFYKAVLTSLFRVALGLFSGITAAVILATISYKLRILNAFISPIISVMKATPVAAIILILWFTLTDASLAVFVVFLMVTPIVWQNVYDGYKTISSEMLEVCEIFELSYKRKLTLLIIPTLLKYLIPATITSIGLAWKAEIAAEIMTYSNIGKSIQDFKSLHYDTASVFAWALVIVILSLILENIAKHLLKRIKI